MIKKLLIILTLILMNTFLNFNVTYASDNSLKNDECSSNLNKRILDDTQGSFPELKILQEKQETGKVTKYNLDDFHKAIIIEGRESSHIKSLLPLFSGTSLGDRHLFIVSGEEALPPKYDNSFIGYLIYKQTDGANVMIKLRRTDKVWEVVSKQKVAGRRILPTKECLDKLINSN
ncbi:MAG: hypothetical protein ABGX20_11365 [Bacillus sp. (in: firmicutes)]